jgi:hypothetical protein
LESIDVRIPGDFVSYFTEEFRDETTRVESHINSGVVCGVLHVSDCGSGRQRQGQKQPGQHVFADKYQAQL